MGHPLHDILMRWLETEQCAFDAKARNDWPWESSDPVKDEEADGDFGELEPQS